jgi:hypothetical protein
VRKKSQSRVSCACQGLYAVKRLAKPPGLIFI